MEDKRCKHKWWLKKQRPCWLHHRHEKLASMPNQNLMQGMVMVPQREMQAMGKGFQRRRQVMQMGSQRLEKWRIYH